MSASRIITEDGDRLDNVHPGSILREDFLIGSDIAVEEVADGACIARERLESVLAESAPIDAAVDIRLARYFGISEGFFLGLQTDYDLEEERRTHGDEIDKIVSRAA
jgi:addiction module HigA family antidote